MRSSLKASISLKLINRSPSKIRGLENIEKLISGGGVYLEPETSLIP